MKRKVILIIFCIYLMTGCSNLSNQNSTKIKGLYVNSNSTIDKLEIHETEREGVTYKELSYLIGKNSKRILLIVTNTTNETVYASGSVQGMFEGKKTSQSSQGDSCTLTRNSSCVLKFHLFGPVDSYKVNGFSVESRKDSYIPYSDFSIVEFNKEYNYSSHKIPKIILKYNGDLASDMLLEAQLIGFKNGEVVYAGSTYLSPVEDKNDYSLDYNSDYVSNGSYVGGNFSDFLTFLSSKNAELTSSDIDEYVYFIYGFPK